MDSPDRNLTITAADTQGSPLFNYLCSLSPIKPVKSVHVVQTFSELSFPPPSAIFVSPRLDTQKASGFLKRNYSIGRTELLRATAESVQGKLRVDKGKGIMIPVPETEDRLSCLNQVADRGHSLGKIHSTKGAQEEQCVLASSPCTSPSKLGNKYVEQYLADPLEEELYPVGSSQQCPKPNSLNLVQFPVYANVDGQQDPGECKQNTKKQLCTSSLAAVKAMEDSEMGMGVGRDAFSQDTVKIMAQNKLGTVAATLKEVDVPDSSKERASSDERLNSQQDCSHDEQSLELSLATTDFSFLLSEGAEKLSLHGSIDDWQNSSASALADSPLEHASGYLATMREIVNENAQGMGMDAVLDSLKDTKSDFALDFKGESDLETEFGSEQQEVAAYRGSVLPYRGVRRRCLDFEASEVQMKNLHSLPSLKTLGLGSTSVQGSSFGSDASLASSMLSERAAATSDATNSESQQGLDSVAHASFRVQMGTRSKSLASHSALFRLTRCSSQKNTECHSDKSDNQLVCITRNSGASPMSVGMPSGIGLHLNSLAGSMTLTQTLRENNNGGSLLSSSKSANVVAEIAPTSSTKEIQSENCGNGLFVGSSGGNLQVGSTASFGSGVVVSVVEKTRMDQHEVQSEGSTQVGVTKSTTCFRSVTLGIKPLERSLPFGGVEKLSPLGRKRVLLQDFPRHTESDVPDDSTQSPGSPKKKRRKSSPAGEKVGEGCKRCNCKKSKCLKLYCECFAAGVYCVDSCSCHDCFNKPEFEDTVLGTRQQIESRNPLAFAPKIIRAADSSPINGEECGDTPASARHKRGCNCKKSHCLKKYCECYQAGVGCSEGCRCEGCKNLYGRKEGPGDFEDKESQLEPTEKEMIEDQTDALELSNAFANPDQQRNQDLSPITPSFQYPGQCRTTPKMRAPAGKRRFLAEELQSPTFSESAVKPSKSPSRLLRSSKVAQNSMAATSAGVHFSKNVGSPISTPEMSMLEQFSPRWDGLGDICTLTPLPQAPLRPTPASVSILDKDNSSPSFNTQNNDHTSSCNGSFVSGSSFLRGSSPVLQQRTPRSPACTSSSNPFQTPLMNNQTTPITPMLSSPLCASVSKSGFVDDLDTYSHHFVGSKEDDDTPEFLKDPDATCSPLRILKTSSPKQKRVSPPHHNGSRDSGNRGMTSPGLKCGRKVILQSIPSIPSATPSFSSGHEEVIGSLNQE